MESAKELQRLMPRAPAALLKETVMAILLVITVVGIAQSNENGQSNANVLASQDAPSAEQTSEMIAELALMHGYH